MGKLIQYRTIASLYDGQFDSTVGWSAAGMGDIIVSDGGKLIVIDGGFENDAEDLLALLEAQTEGRNPEVKLWIITHPHIDHYGALRAISKDPALLRRVSIKQIIYQFPMEFVGKDGVPGALKNSIKELEEICAATGAEPHYPIRDERILVDETEIHFLYVPDDCSLLNTAGGNANLCSLIFMVKGKNKKALITGDAYPRTLLLTAWHYAEELKCDILQMPHHALCDAYCKELYGYADPDIILMPTSIAGYRAMHDTYANWEGGAINITAESKAKEVYKSFDGTIILDI